MRVRWIGAYPKGAAIVLRLLAMPTTIGGAIFFVPTNSEVVHGIIGSAKTTGVASEVEAFGAMDFACKK